MLQLCNYTKCVFHSQMSFEYLGILYNRSLSVGWCTSASLSDQNCRTKSKRRSIKNFLFYRKSRISAPLNDRDFSRPVAEHRLLSVAEAPSHQTKPKAPFLFHSLLCVCTAFTKFKFQFFVVVSHNLYICVYRRQNEY